MKRFHEAKWNDEDVDAKHEQTQWQEYPHEGGNDLAEPLLELLPGRPESRVVGRGDCQYGNQSPSAGYEGNENPIRNTHAHCFEQAHRDAGQDAAGDHE